MSVIIYQEHCEMLEKENEELKQEILFLKTMLEYNPIPTNKTQFDSGVQMTRKRNRKKKHKNVFSEIKTLKNGDTKND